ncbi:hypothetical protein HMPREF0043_02182 [Actinobaculum sp. oral taxon 183 str. F0552]|nr:hypothetical protein HMPREF0043_02182 [Actinobaculum sp. oral taxon 183 str. F0552]
MPLSVGGRCSGAYARFCRDARVNSGETGPSAPPAPTRGAGGSAGIKALPPLIHQCAALSHRIFLPVRDPHIDTLDSATTLCAAIRSLGTDYETREDHETREEKEE